MASVIPWLQSSSKKKCNHFEAIKSKENMQSPKTNVSSSMTWDISYYDVILWYRTHKNNAITLNFNLLE